jgi:hypothetical protein
MSALLFRRKAWNSASPKQRRLACTAAVQQLIAAQPVAIPILRRFTGVYILDSTTITLPDTLAAVGQGCGGSTPGTAAALKIQGVWNLATGAFEHLSLQHGRASDQRAPVQEVVLPPGALRIADLGYFALDQMAWLHSQGSYVLSRWYPHTRLFDLLGQPLILLDLLHQHASPTLDLPVLLGANQRVPVRLLALRVPQEVAWVVLVRCWHDAQRSLPNVAHLLQGHALTLGAAVLKSPTTRATYLAHISRWIQVGCRINPRKRRPNPYQLLLALGEGA